MDRPKSDSTFSTSIESSLGAAPGLQWTSVLDAVPDGVSVHSATGKIVWANKGLCEIYCKTLLDWKGLSCQRVFHDEDSSCPHEKVLATGCGARLENEVRVSGRVLSVTIEPLRDQRNETRGFIRIMRDVTGERRAQEQLLNAERFATLGQVLSGIAHDVGTPLNIISGYSEFLLMRTKPEDQGHKELSTILHQTRRIAKLLHEALDLARAPHRRNDSIDIEGFLAQSLDLAGYYLRKADVAAALTCRIGARLVYGEASQLKQAFFNLLLNAGKQVGTGGKLEVVIDEAPDKPGFLTLALWGTDASGRGHDFSQSFAWFLAPHSEAGTALLGLSLVKEILDEAGARVTSGAAGERGVPFIVYLPVNARNQS